MKNILVIEDQFVAQELIKRTLSQDSMQLTVAGTCKAAREFFSKKRWDLILLDIELPDGDGVQFFSEIQQSDLLDEVPVIFLTGKDDISHKVATFAMGAEDYIVKPFNLIELRARVLARLKKREESEGAKNQFARGPLRFDVSALQLVIDLPEKKQKLKLTPREFKIIYHLALHEGEILSRDQLLELVWGGSEEVYDRTIDTHISAVRKKLGPVLGSSIQSISGSGYRFTAPHQ